MELTDPLLELKDRTEKLLNLLNDEDGRYMYTWWMFLSELTKEIGEWENP